MMNSNDAMHKAIALHQQALDLRSFLSMHEFHMHEQAIDADDEEEEDSSSPVHASYSSLELRRGIILFDPKDMEQHDDPFHLQLEDNQTHDQSTSSCYHDNQKTHDSDSDSHSEKTIDIRNKIIIEICSTERNYVRDIRILHDFYIVPLEEHKHPIMEDAQIAVFFNNLRQLVMLNSKLQNDLMTIILQRHLSLDGSESISSDSNTNSHTSSEGIGAVFCRYAPLFKLYGGYAKNYQEVAQFLNKCKQDKSFSDFLLTCESKSPSNKSFDSLLIMPIQRIPLYQLLLIRMCEYTSMDHPDYEFLHQAVARIESAASLINETIRDQENLSRVVEAQQQFAGQVSLITPTRRLLKKGMLIKISTRRSEAVMIHLFNDLLLYSGVLLTGGYRVRRVVQLNSKAVRIQNQVPSTYRTVCSINTHQNGFLITSLEKTFVLFASNLKEKNEWVDAIVDAIRIAQTSSPLKMESPADAAALWVPDAVAGACSVCLVSFKVYFRRHHCRRCGAVVCGNCSDHRSILFVTDSVKEERVCAPCFRVLSRVKRLALKWIDHMILFRGILRRKRSNQKWSEYYYELRAGVLKQYTLASANPANPKGWLESVLLAGAIVIHRSDERAAKNQFSFQISMGMEEEEEDPHVESEESEDEGRISPCTTHSPQDSHPPSPLSSTSRTMSSSRLRQKLVARFQSKRRTSSSTHSGLSSEGSMNGFQNRMDYGWILSATCYEEEKKWSLAIQQSADQALHKTRRSHVVDFNPGQDVESASEQPISDLNLTPSVVVSDGELQRIRIVYEIIRSEESYITCLEECIQLYIQPLLLRQLETQKMNNLRKIQSTPTLLSHAKKKKEKLNKHKILLDADMAIFFNSMDQLCTLNQQLLEHLSRHADEMKETGASYRPGAIFNAYAPLFQLYTSYASRYEGALKIITSLPFQTFVEQLPNQHTTVHRFKTFLNMPMERIPSYKIFLTELLQYTASDHMDYLPLQNAIASIHRVALKVEEIIKRREHMDRIEILSNKVGMDLTGKTFIQEGFLQKVCRSKVQNYYFLLMDDALIYGRMGTHLHKKKFRQIDLWECKIQGNTTSIPDVIPNATNAFSFFSPLKSFILLASSLEEKMKWIHSIQECIDKTLHTPTTTYRRPSIRSELLLDDTPFQESTSLWNSETAARLVIKNGWLNVVSEEKTRKMTTTRRLWITLTQQNITFASTFKGAQPEEIIDIESCQASSMTEETYFQLCTSCGPRVYLFETQSYIEREEWLRALNHCISNSTILGTNNTNVLEIRRRSLNTATLAPIFMFNKVSNVCTLCYHPFAVYRPRHHCRVCGCLVCGNCSKRKWALSYSSSKKASRVCDHCADTACQSVTSTVLEM